MNCSTHIYTVYGLSKFAAIVVFLKHSSYVLYTAPRNCVVGLQLGLQREWHMVGNKTNIEHNFPMQIHIQKESHLVR